MVVRQTPGTGLGGGVTHLDERPVVPRFKEDVSTTDEEMQALREKLAMTPEEMARYDGDGHRPNYSEDEEPLDLADPPWQEFESTVPDNPETAIPGSALESTSGRKVYEPST